MNEIRNVALTKFFNAAFNSIDNDLLTISSLSDPELVETILLYIDNKFFQNIGLLPPDNETNRIYNMGLILNRIENYYQYIIKSPIQENFFLVKDKSQQNLLHLAQLITGITAQCQKREEYLNTMNNLPEDISNELMKILFELIPVDDVPSEKSNEKEDKSEEDEDKANENAMLWIRAENAEKECERLNEEMNKMSIRIADLTQSNYTYELSLKETEAKYQELVLIVGKREHEIQTDSNQNYIEQVTLSIQLSELKGKLDAKEKNFFKFREEKEKIIADLKESNFTLKKENLTLKESSVKFEVLKEQMKKFSMEEMNALKQKIIQNEKLIKEKEKEIRKLKNYDSDKVILLKKIEDLNYELSIEKEKTYQLQKESEEYRFNIVLLEKEKENDTFKLKKSSLLSSQTSIQGFDITHSHTTNFKEENNRYSNSSKQLDDKHISSNQLSDSSAMTMQKIDEDEAQKMRLVELETKVKLLQSEKDQLSKGKLTQNELIQQNNAIIKEQKEQLDKLNKKLEKYSQFKKENQTFISKITDLMDKVEDANNENLRLKNIKVEIENSYNDQLIAANKTIAETQLKIKELESQISLLKNEINQYEEHLKSNKEYIDQLKQKTTHPETDIKVIEMEKKLKEMTENENNDLKKKCKEKDEIISKQKEKIIKVDNDMKELALKIERLPSEIAKRDEAIEYYTTQLEQKEKMHNDEMRIIAGLYHSLSYQCLNLREKDKERDREKDKERERYNVNNTLNNIR